MLVKLQKAGKVPEVLCSYLINAVWFLSQKGRTQNNWEAAITIFPVDLSEGSFAFCFFLHSPDVDAVQLAFSISFN